MPRSTITLALLIALAPPSSATARPSPPEDLALETRAIEFQARSGETVAAEYGTFSVPENRDRPNGKHLRLAFVRFSTTADRPGPPIVYLAGGPGGSGIDAARGSRFPLFMALRARADVVAFDQRGTGDSEGDLSCDESYALPFDRPLDRRRVGELAAAASRRCIEGLRAAGHDPASYQTVASSDDLMDLRRALGAEKLTLLGISYGSHLGLATLKRHDSFVEKAVLAGVEPLHHTWKLPLDQQRLLEQIAGLVSRDEAIHSAVPDLLGAIRRILDQLAAHPAVVRLTQPLTGETAEMTLGALDLQVYLADMLRGPDSFAALPDAVTRLATGDFVGLALAMAPRRLGTIRDGMPLAVDCASGMSDTWSERIAREAPTTLLGSAIDLPFPEVCAGVGVPDLGEEFRAPVQSRIPVLLISGTLDGRTPPSNAEEVLPGLPNARHLVIEGAGHGSDLFLSSPRILEEIERFLAGAPLASDRITLPTPELIAPRHVVAVPPTILARYVGTYRIDANETRRVFLAGSQLFTQRNEGPPFAIRPLSANRFFYEGSATWLDIVVDATGQPVEMRMHHDGAEEAEVARFEAATAAADG